MAFRKWHLCPRSVRQQLIHQRYSVVYSTEVPGAVKLLPLPEEEFEKGKINELGAFDDFRVRILPVLGQSMRFNPQRA